MVYFKILSSDGTVKSEESLADPVYVSWQTRNGILIRCDKRDAQGVMSGDGNTIYQLQGKQLSGVESDELLSAVCITLAEYDELAAQVGTTEDDGAGGRLNDAGERVQQSGFAGAGRADDDHDFTLFDIDRNAVERLDGGRAGKMLFQILNLDQNVSGHCCAASFPACLPDARRIRP